MMSEGGQPQRWTKENERRWLELVEQGNNAWHMALSGHYAEALRQMDAVLTQRQDMQAYHSRGKIRLLVRDYAGALSDFKQGRRLALYVVSEFVGVALWLAGEREDACEDWANEIARLRAREITHADGGGIQIPALLWWAAAHPEMRRWKKSAEEEIKRLWSKNIKCRESLWPGSLAPYLQGRITDTALLVAASDRYSEIQARHMCQAHFYIGASYLSNGDLQRCQQHLKWALTPGHISEAEYHLARSEYVQLSGENNLPIWTHDNMLAMQEAKQSRNLVG